VFQAVTSTCGVFKQIGSGFLDALFLTAPKFDCFVITLVKCVMGLRRGAGGIFFQKTHFRMGGDLWELQGKEKPTFLSFFLHCYLWKAATEVSLSVIQRFVNRTKSFLAPRLNCITPAPSRCVFRGSSLELYVSLLLRTVLHASSNRCSFRQEGFAVGVIPTSLSELSSLMCSLLKGLLRWPLTPCATVKLLLTCWLS